MMNKFLLTGLSFSLAVTVHAQQGKVLTTQDYEHAESMMTYNTEPYVVQG
jgi:dipeptidyl-peptidase-4